MVVDKIFFFTHFAMQIRIFLMSASPLFANPQFLWLIRKLHIWNILGVPIRRSQIRNFCFSTENREDETPLIKRSAPFGPVIAEPPKIRLQVCSAEFLFMTNLNLTILSHICKEKIIYSQIFGNSKSAKNWLCNFRNLFGGPPTFENSIIAVICGLINHRVVKRLCIVFLRT